MFSLRLIDTERAALQRNADRLNRAEGNFVRGAIKLAIELARCDHAGYPGVLRPSDRCGRCGAEPDAFGGWTRLPAVQAFLSKE